MQVEGFRWYRTSIMYVHYDTYTCEVGGPLEIGVSIVAQNTLCGAGNGPGALIDPIALGKGCPSEICAAQSLVTSFPIFNHLHGNSTT